MSTKHQGYLHQLRDAILKKRKGFFVKKFHKMVTPLLFMKSLFFVAKNRGF